MQDCDNNEESSYECAKIMFAVKNKGVTPPTLQGIKEDQLLLKNDAMVHVNNTVTSYKKIKVKKYIDYSIPNIVKCNFGTFSDTGMKIKDCHYLGEGLRPVNIQMCRRRCPVIRQDFLKPSRR